MTAIQRAVVDDLGNINVHGRSGLVVVVKIETATEGEYEDISDRDLFFEVSGKYRVTLAAGDTNKSRKIVLTRAQAAQLPLTAAVDFALVDETPDTPGVLWSGQASAYGFRTAPTGDAEVDGAGTNWTGGTVIIRQANTTPTVIIRREGPPGARVVSFPLYASGRPDAGETLLRLELDTAITFDASRSQASAETGATGSSVFTIYINGSSIGTVTFGAGSSSGTVALTTTTASAGDVLKIVGPNPQDATLAGVSITLSADR